VCIEALCGHTSFIQAIIQTIKEKPMADNISDIQAFYDGYADKEIDRLERHQLEHDITWRYLDKYLPARGKILEIGAATGTYTIPLAKRGYSVTAVDLSSKLLEVCRKRVAEEGLERKVTCLVADARDLSKVGNTLFDVVLMMGPLYHLVEEEDRKMALNEAYKRLKPGGRIFSAFVSRYGIWGNEMVKFPGNIITRQEDLRSVLKDGRDVDRTHTEGGFRAYFSNVMDITPLHEQAGFRTLALAGVEPAGVPDGIYTALQGETRKAWLDLLFSISAEKTVIGASCHILYIGEKIGK
jgi:S-adenosylmethionine-dependent methyltransferase